MKMIEKTRYKSLSSRINNIHRRRMLREMETSREIEWREKREMFPRFIHLAIDWSSRNEYLSCLFRISL